jgi:hypothetical protein
MIETQLVESNQNIKKKDLRENHIAIRIKITKMKIATMKTTTDTTMIGGAMIEGAMTTEDSQATEEVVSSTRVTVVTTRVAVAVNTTLVTVIIRITKGMTKMPAITTKIMFIWTATNASRNTALTMSKLDIHKTTLNTKEDTLEQRTTSDESTAEGATGRTTMSLKTFKTKMIIASRGRGINESSRDIVTTNMKRGMVFTKKEKSLQ